ATSLASVGTGLPPGVHGLPGYTVRNPDTGELMNQLRWQPWTQPAAWQPYPTIFERAHRAGVHAAQVSSPAFVNTPLTKVALSGGTFHGRLSGEERMDLAAGQLAAADRSLVYTYYSDVDGAGHGFGVAAATWRGQLMYVDRLVQRLAEQLPERSALYVTADHGMIDVPFDEEHRIDFDADWELSAGVALLGGEGRARHVYAVPGAAGDVLACWREVLGEQFWVASRDEAIAAGWFGPRVDERVYGRIGDVIAAARDDVLLIASEREPKETAMVGNHGSMTAAEQLVPRLEVRSIGPHHPRRPRTPTTGTRPILAERCPTPHARAGVLLRNHGLREVDAGSADRAQPFGPRPGGCHLHPQRPGRRGQVVLPPRPRHGRGGGRGGRRPLRPPGRPPLAGRTRGLRDRRRGAVPPPRADRPARPRGGRPGHRRLRLRHHLRLPHPPVPRLAAARGAGRPGRGAPGGGPVLVRRPRHAQRPHGRRGHGRRGRPGGGRRRHRLRRRGRLRGPVPPPPPPPHDRGHGPRGGPVPGRPADADRLTGHARPVRSGAAGTPTGR